MASLLPIIKTKALVPFTAPVLVIGAEKDVFFPVKKPGTVAPKIFQNLIKMEIIPNTSHLLTIKAQQIANSHIHRFLSEMDMDKTD